MKRTFRKPLWLLSAVFACLPLLACGGEAQPRATEGNNPQDPNRMETRSGANTNWGTGKVNEGGANIPITNPLDILQRKEPKALESRSVRLTGVRVQQVLSPQYLFVGPDEKRVLLVRLNKLYPQIKVGSVIDVSGVIAQLGEDLAHWSLNPDMKKLAAEKEIFINVLQAEVQSADDQEEREQSPPPDGN